MFSLIPWKRSHRTMQPWTDSEAPLVELRREFDSLWERFLSDWNAERAGEFGLNGGRNLALEEKADEYLVRAEVPGFEPNELDVRLSGRTLVIRAEQERTEKSEQGEFYRRGSFHRSVTLPMGVEAEKIDAHYHNGVLELHLPKSPEAMGKQIPVNAA